MFFRRRSGDSRRIARSFAAPDLIMQEDQAVKTTSALIERIRGEFNEMPGLQLTIAQASRLWGLEASACRHVIESLVNSEFLRWTQSGTIVRDRR